MRKTDALLVVASALTMGSQSAHAAGCNVTLNVTDKDPVGLNVRATPAGAIIGVLNGAGNRVEVHVTDQSGAWARIDKAELIPAGRDANRKLFSGAGYVAFTKIGVEYLSSNTELKAAPRDDARVLLTLPPDNGGWGPRAEVIGCSGEFIEVRVSGLVGWTQAYILTGAPP